MLSKSYFYTFLNTIWPVNSHLLGTKYSGSVKKALEIYKRNTVLETYINETKGNELNTGDLSKGIQEKDKRKGTRKA